MLAMYKAKKQNNHMSDAIDYIPKPEPFQPTQNKPSK